VQIGQGLLELIGQVRLDSDPVQEPTVVGQLSVSSGMGYSSSEGGFTASARSRVS